MPTYEYVCSACKNEWEVEQSMKDNALTECPRCKEQTARRQISRGTGFILKGGGWYSGPLRVELEQGLLVERRQRRQQQRLEQHLEHDGQRLEHDHGGARSTRRAGQERDALVDLRRRVTSRLA